MSTTKVNELTSIGNIADGDVLVGERVNGTTVRITFNGTAITTLGTVTTGTWNADTIAVAYGGTGATTFTSNALLKGNGTSAVQASGLIVDGSDNLTNSSTTPDLLWGVSSLPTNTRVVFNTGSSFVCGTDSTSDTTNKTFRFGCPHYTNSEEPMVGLLCNATSGANALNIGGGTGLGNAATEVNIYAAADNTTVTGTEIASYTLNGFESATGGDFLWGATTLPTNTNVVFDVGSSFLCGTDTASDATNKTFRFGCPHYTNSEQPVTGFVFNNTATENTVNIGGGTGLGNAATDVRIRAAANNTTTGGTEIARFDINGLSFDGGTNHLDEYEEGTWTPTFTLVTAPTYNTQTGRYTRIGNLVQLDFLIDFSSLDTADASAISIASIPFDLANADFVMGNIDTLASTALSIGTAGTHIISDGFTTAIKFCKGTGVTYRYNGGEISASGILTGTFLYRV